MHFIPLLLQTKSSPAAIEQKGKYIINYVTIHVDNTLLSG